MVNQADRTVEVMGPDADDLVWLRLVREGHDTLLSFTKDSIQGKALLDWRDGTETLPGQ